MKVSLGPRRVAPTRKAGIVTLVAIAASLLSLVVTTPSASAATSHGCGGGSFHGTPIPTAANSPIMKLICADKTLKAGVAVAFPDLLQNLSTGAYFGPAITLANKIASVLHVKLDLVLTNFGVLAPAIEAQDYELDIAPTFATPVREQVLSFVNYDRAGTCYAVLKSDHSINSLSDLNKPSTRMLVYTGNGNTTGDEAKYPKATYVTQIEPPGGQLVGMVAIEAHRADVFPIDSGVAIIAVDKYPQFKILPGGPKYCIAHPDIPYPVGMAFTKGDTKFSAFLTAIVASMKKALSKEVIKYSKPQYFS